MSFRVSRRQAAAATIVAVAGLILVWKHPSRADAWFNPWLQHRAPDALASESVVAELRPTGPSMAGSSAGDYAPAADHLIPFASIATDPGMVLRAPNGAFRSFGPAWGPSAFRIGGSSSGAASLRGSGKGFGGGSMGSGRTAATTAANNAAPKTRTATVVPSQPAHPKSAAPPARSPKAPARPGAPMPSDPFPPFAPVPPAPTFPLFPPSGPPITPPSGPSPAPTGAPLSTTPEPNSLMLLGTGLLAAGGFFQRRRK